MGVWIAEGETAYGMGIATRWSLIGIIEDIARSLAFYRRVGPDIPRHTDDRSHAERPLADGMTLFWNAFFVGNDDRGREPPAGGYRLILEFILEGRVAVAAKYAELVISWYRGDRAVRLLLRGPHRHRARFNTLGHRRSPMHHPLAELVNPDNALSATEAALR